MLIFWRIRYLDRAERRLKYRQLFLDTATLPPATKAAVELTVETKSQGSDRDFLKHRSLFCEDSLRDINTEPMQAGRGMIAFSLPNYFEDETGTEIAWPEIGPILTGDPNTILAPSGIKKHDIDLVRSEGKTLPIADVSLSDEEVRLLGYFVRDVQELRDSALRKDGPGALTPGGTLFSVCNQNSGGDFSFEDILTPGGTGPLLPNANFHFETAVTDDEIRSYVMIFRRLYMTGQHDPASFLKTILIFTKAVGDNPYGAWVAESARQYESHLASSPELLFMQERMWTFTTKQLIDVFLYTQYAHQPSEKCQRQFNTCLQQVNGERELLTYMFLSELWKCGLEIVNVGGVIADWFKRYCDHHGITPDVLNSLRDEHPGLGTAEKKEAIKDRLFREKVEELELELWKQAGKPEGGPVQFRLRAQEQLKNALNGAEGCQ